MDLLDPACKNSDLMEMLYLISREALSGQEIDRPKLRLRVQPGAAVEKGQVLLEFEDSAAS